MVNFPTFGDIVEEQTARVGGVGIGRRRIRIRPGRRAAAGRIWCVKPARIVDTPVRINCEILEVVGIHMNRQANLFLLAETLRPLRLGLGLSKRGQQHCCQNSDNGDDDEQFDKRKGVMSPPSSRFTGSGFGIHVFRIVTYFRIIRKNPEPSVAGTMTRLVAEEPGTSCQFVVRPIPEPVNRDEGGDITPLRLSNCSSSSPLSLFWQQCCCPRLLRPRPRRSGRNVSASRNRLAWRFICMPTTSKISQFILTGVSTILAGFTHQIRPAAARLPGRILIRRLPIPTPPTRAVCSSTMAPKVGKFTIGPPILPTPRLGPAASTVYPPMSCRARFSAIAERHLWGKRLTSCR